VTWCCLFAAACTTIRRQMKTGVHADAGIKPKYDVSRGIDYIKRICGIQGRHLEAAPYITGCAVAQHCCKGGQSFPWESPNFDPPPVFPKPLNFSTPKFAQMITSGMSPNGKNLVKICSQGASPRIGDCVMVKLEFYNVEKVIFAVYTFNH